MITQSSNFNSWLLIEFNFFTPVRNYASPLNIWTTKNSSRLLQWVSLIHLILHLYGERVGILPGHNHIVFWDKLHVPVGAIGRNAELRSILRALQLCIAKGFRGLCLSMVVVPIFMKSLLFRIMAITWLTWVNLPPLAPASSNACMEIKRTSSGIL